MKYDKNGGWKNQHCEICQEYKLCCQHHTGHRRYSDEIIWICNSCHAEIHRDPKTAYEKGYLVKHNKSYKIEMKEKKTKTCDHSKTFNVFLNGQLIIKCNYCGKQVNEAKFGTHKKKEQSVDVVKV